MTDYVLTESRVHTLDCPTIRHQIERHRRPDEQAPFVYEIIDNLGAEQRLVLERRGDAAPSYYTPRVVTGDELRLLTRKYQRCRVCAPDAPEYNPRARTHSKLVSALSRADLGRMTEAGPLERIVHEHDTVTVTIGGETSILPTDERIVFLPKTGVHRTGAD